MTSRAARRGRRRRAKEVREVREREAAVARLALLRSPAHKERYLADPRPTCPACGLPRSTVETRRDPYYIELVWDFFWLYRSCIPCWRQRYYDS